MKEDIYNFSQQFQFLPEIKNSKKWDVFEDYVLIGMGGSHLQGDIFKAIFPNFPLSIYQDYGIPSDLNESKTGIIMASYSGNTEEVIDAYEKAIEKNIPVSVISKGGKLLGKAKKDGSPYVELPSDNIQPRIGVGYTFKALLELLNVDFDKGKIEDSIKNIENKKIHLEEKGKKIALLLEEKVPIVYSTRRNFICSSMWKINFNETSKIPAFFNVLPELNHNEMTGFDVISSTEKLSKNFVFIFLRDEDDFPRNKKRMDVLKDVLNKRNFEVIDVEIEGDFRAEKIFYAILLSEWTSYYLGGFYNTEREDVPMVEEFKKLI